jgi:hypothetical protein
MDYARRNTITEPLHQLGIGTGFDAVVERLELDVQRRHKSLSEAERYTRKFNRAEACQTSCAAHAG